MLTRKPLQNCSHPNKSGLQLAENAYKLPGWLPLTVGLLISLVGVIISSASLATELITECQDRTTLLVNGKQLEASLGYVKGLPAAEQEAYLVGQLSSALGQHFTRQQALQSYVEMDSLQLYQKTTYWQARRIVTMNQRVISVSADIPERSSKEPVFTIKVKHNGDEASSWPWQINDQLYPQAPGSTEQAELLQALLAGSNLGLRNPATGIEFTLEAKLILDTLAQAKEDCAGTKAGPVNAI